MHLFSPKFNEVGIYCDDDTDFHLLNLLIPKLTNNRINLSEGEGTMSWGCMIFECPQNMGSIPNLMDEDIVDMIKSISSPREVEINKDGDLGERYVLTETDVIKFTRAVLARAMGDA